MILFDTLRKRWRNLPLFFMPILLKIFHILLVIYEKKGVIIMGIIKAGVGAPGGTLADQWKEYFYCESMSKDVLATKGQKRISKRSSNTKGNILYECFQYICRIV